MFFRGKVNNLTKSIKSSLWRSSMVAHSEGAEEEDGIDIDSSVPSLVQQANETLEKDRAKIKPPGGFDTIKNVLSVGTVNSYDGFRMIVQKQVNLNAVVSHFYWIGAQAMGQPIYQYRLILPFDDKVVNVATDVDLSNVEGEVKFPLTANITSKTNFLLGEQSNITSELEIVDESSNTQFSVTKGGESSFTMSFVQAINPYLTLGGSSSYTLKSQSLTTAFAGIFSYDEHLLAAQYDNNLRVLYQRKINPNRVHLTSDLLVDDQGNSQMSLGAEYMLKQSKVHMSIDSNLMLKSLVETQLAPGVTMQFGAEMIQYKNHYRFGYGIVMG